MSRALALTCLVLTLFSSTLCGSTLYAQEATSAIETARAEMQQLDFLLGRWQGAGWIEYEPGQRLEFHGEETVERRLDGLLVEVEGRHWEGARGGADAKLVHHALGIFSWVNAGRYRFSTYLASGRTGNAEAWLDNGKLIWQLSPGEMKIRYTIEVRDGSWIEVGEMSRDGESWRQFFAMTLTRTQ